MRFDDLSKTATGHPGGGYEYPRRLACGKRHAEDTETGWLCQGMTCASRLMKVPPGLGKTAGVVLAWLGNWLVPALNPQLSTRSPLLRLALFEALFRAAEVRASKQAARKL